MLDCKRQGQRIARWVERTFGVEYLTNVEERAARVLEEAVELAQANGVSPPLVHAIIKRAYDRPPGEARKEAAQLLELLLCYAHVTGTDLEPLLEQELTFIETADPNYFREKMKAKRKLGTIAVPEQP